MLNHIFAEWNWSVPSLPVDSWWFCLIVLAVLVIFIWVIARLTTSATEDIDPAEIDRQMLTAVNDLHSRGELTQEEFRSIKSRLVRRLADEESGAGSADLSHQDRQSEERKGLSSLTTEVSGRKDTSDDGSDPSDPGKSE